MKYECSKCIFTEFPICSDMNSVDGNKENPENETDDPGIPICPKLQDKLSSRQVGRHGDSIVEPVIPRQGEPVRRGEEARSVCVEGP